MIHTITIDGVKFRVKNATEYKWVVQMMSNSLYSAEVLPMTATDVKKRDVWSAMQRVEPHPTFATSGHINATALVDCIMPYCFHLPRKTVTKYVRELLK